MKKIMLFLLISFAFMFGCSSMMEAAKPTILEGRIVDKYADVEHLTSGNCEWNAPRGYVNNPCTHFIHIDYYIVIADGDKKQKVKVTESEYDGLQKGWLVDVSAKYPYWAPRIKAEKEKVVK